jgi:hypothetical protein
LYGVIDGQQIYVNLALREVLSNFFWGQSGEGNSGKSQELLCFHLFFLPTWGCFISIHDHELYDFWGTNSGASEMGVLRHERQGKGLLEARCVRTGGSGCQDASLL